MAKRKMSRMDDFIYGHQIGALRSDLTFEEFNSAFKRRSKRSREEEDD